MDQSKETFGIKEDEVDVFLEKQDGLIKRGRDPNFCKHSIKGMCDYCMPLEPYDPRYLEQNKIKHMSFHAYLRSLNPQRQSTAKVSKQLPPLEEPDYKVKKNCPGRHSPWPEGICTKCQPSAITLGSQTWRMVDHIEFSTPGLIDNFINYWRSTGCQRFGYLYGRYEPYKEVPLGIKAVVEAIYEPPQDNLPDGLELTLPWPQETMVDEVARLCGLQKVGMIFTDLLDDGSGKGTVVTKRHGDSYFLSSLECCFAAQMQSRYPNPSKFSPTGHFGSKFVTCVVSGNEEGNIDVASYQVSNTCVGMVEAGIVEASLEPGVMLVKKSIVKELYVPEVFYRYKNKYGANVQESAKPTFPVEYLLVTVTHGFPQSPNPMFTSTASFPTENRPTLTLQDTATLRRFLDSAQNPTSGVSDFHLLCYIGSLGILQEDDLKLLASVASGKMDERGQGAIKLVETEGWKNLLAAIKDNHDTGSATGKASTSTPMSRSTTATSSSSSGPTAIPVRTASPPLQIECRHCTLYNPETNTECDACGLPLRD